MYEELLAAVQDKRDAYGRKAARLHAAAEEADEERRKMEDAILALQDIVDDQDKFNDSAADLLR